MPPRPIVSRQEADQLKAGLSGIFNLLLDNVKGRDCFQAREVLEKVSLILDRVAE